MMCINNEVYVVGRDDNFQYSSHIVRFTNISSNCIALKHFSFWHFLYFDVSQTNAIQLVCFEGSLGHSVMHWISNPRILQLLYQTRQDVIVTAAVLYDENVLLQRFPVRAARVNMPASPGICVLTTASFATKPMTALTPTMKMETIAPPKNVFSAII